MRFIMNKHPTLTSLLLIGLLASTAPVVAEIYTWVDANGNTVFSDHPEKGASKIKLPPPQTYAPTAIKPSTPATPKAEPAPPRYHLLSIIQPLDDQSLWANNGQIDLVLAIEPALAVAQGHHILIKLDGQIVISNTQETRLNLKDVDRGSHTLSATIQDSSDKTLIESKPVTLHVLRQSILHKKQATAP